jgi:hypothetical protein
MRFTREISDPTYCEKPWAERWEGPDGGLIASWEAGRQKSAEDPALAALARGGELVVLPWKGGVAKKIKVPYKYGSLLYLAMWQGLRGDSLDVSLEDEVTLTCTRTGMKMIYTPDATKYAEA